MSKRGHLVRLGLGAAAMLALVGCAELDSNVARFEADVQSVSLGEPYAISAQDLAQAMLQAGFKPSEILEYGPKVRNAIGAGGGAQINDGRTARAMLTVQEDQLYITSREVGTFIHDL